jgi:hypothetical protein
MSVKSYSTFEQIESCQGWQWSLYFNPGQTSAEFHIFIGVQDKFDLVWRQLTRWQKSQTISHVELWKKGKSHDFSLYGNVQVNPTNNQSNKCGMNRTWSRRTPRFCRMSQMPTFWQRGYGRKQVHSLPDTLSDSVYCKAHRVCLWPVPSPLYPSCYSYRQEQLPITLVLITSMFRIPSPGVFTPQPVSTEQTYFESCR